MKHIDIWTGTPDANGGNAQILCENALTPDNSQQVIRNPPNNLAVDSACNPPLQTADKSTNQSVVATI